ncbi:DNA-binding response regulator [Desulfosarcina widdelii]|uniref:DNA-binding response regulator n=1 Tax=Desulfosarcina widdelii TaxID=947919 RepID=A0A5K7Z8T7_9BACT|nr:two-component system response regulator CreB [Desulfosarcina widdelii]BBO76569.1 DNA-binding response regulator [Desulfosarcina widdelii]
MAKILIVEDEPAIADTIQYALETEGFTPLMAPTGQEALEQMAVHAVDLVILDIGLPDINGFELCKRIRHHSALPIIFLTARSEEVDRVVGLEIGGDDYVVKPFSPRELTARVKAVLRRTRSDAPALSSAQTVWAVDEARRRIQYFGCRLKLSRTEFDLLRILIRRPGLVFTREQLMAAVWDEPEASMDRTVDAHIKNLRAKLKGVKADLDPIVTHRGTGYALKENITPS